MTDDKMMLSKPALRKSLNNLIKQISDTEITSESNSIAEIVLKHPTFIKAKSVSIYLSFDKEVQTQQILKGIFEQSKTCYIPRFLPNNPYMEMLKLDSYKTYSQLPLNKWNIKQHPDDATVESVFDKGTLDLVLLPGLGFTKDGKRLGRGKGYYDKFLAECKDKLPTFPYTIGLALSKQIVSDIPVDDTDWNVDEVIFCS